MKSTTSIILKCFFDKEHFVCRNPVRIPCEKTKEKNEKFACLDCILHQINHTGAFECKICETEHRVVLSNKKDNTLLTHALKNKNIKDISQDLLSLSSRSIAKLQGIFN
jgi:hypothetical protein